MNDPEDQSPPPRSAADADAPQTCVEHRKENPHGEVDSAAQCHRILFVGRSEPAQQAHDTLCSSTPPMHQHVRRGECVPTVMLARGAAQDRMIDKLPSCDLQGPGTKQGGKQNALYNLHAEE